MDAVNSIVLLGFGGPAWRLTTLGFDVGEPAVATATYLVAAVTAAGPLDPSRTSSAAEAPFDPSRTAVSNA